MEYRKLIACSMDLQISVYVTDEKASD